MASQPDIIAINAFVDALGFTQIFSRSAKFPLFDLEFERFKTISGAYAALFTPAELISHFCGALKVSIPDAISGGLGKQKGVDELTAGDMRNIGAHLKIKCAAALKEYDMTAALYAHAWEKGLIARPNNQPTPMKEIEKESVILGRGLLALRLRNKLLLNMEKNGEQATSLLSRHNIKITSSQLEKLESGDFTINEETKKTISDIARAYTNKLIATYETFLDFARSEGTQGIQRMQRLDDERRGRLKYPGSGSSQSK